MSRLEPGDNRVTTIAVGSDPIAVAFGDGALWVAESGDRTVAQVSPTANKVTQRIEIANAPSAIAVGDGSVWVGSAVDQTVSRIGADGAQDAVHLGAPPSAIAVGAGAVWVISEEHGTLFRLDPRSGTVVRALQVGNRPVAVAAGDSGVWVANRQDATVWRVDPASDSVTDTIRVGREPGAIAIADGDVWVAGDGRVTRIDGRTRRIAETVTVGSTPVALAADGRSLWTATHPTLAAHRGGTVIVAAEPGSYPEDPDPTLYDTRLFEILSLAYDGLLTFRRTGGTTYGPLVANLAEDVPEASADGRTYVIELRRGIRCSNGDPLEPEDFRVSLEHLLTRAGEQFAAFDAIIGVPRCVREPDRCDLSAGITTDARANTITLRLSRPDPALLYWLAHPLSYVAPAAHPFGPGQTPPGTGPYRVARVDTNSGIELVRNPHFRVWSQDARPDGLPDSIRVRPDPASPLDVVERGEADIAVVADAFGTNVPAQEIHALALREPDRLHTASTPSLTYLWLNVNEAPFDDVRVRRAINYAIDRTAVAQIEGGEPLANPACHFIAHGHPGYTAECMYARAGFQGVAGAPDLARAQALVAQSNTAGQVVTVHVPTEKRAVGRYVARLLDRLGYRGRLRVPGDYPEYHDLAGDSRNGVQLGTDGWAADLPSPVDFATPFRCENFVPRSPANINLAQFCDGGFERRIRAALAARGAEADARWRDAYAYLSRAAPAAPLVNRRGAVFTSTRLGNYQHHPLFGVLLDQAWVR